MVKMCRQKEHIQIHVGDYEESYVWKCVLCGAGSMYKRKTKRQSFIEPADNKIILEQMTPVSKQELAYQMEVANKELRKRKQ